MYILPMKAKAHFILQHSLYSLSYGCMWEVSKHKRSVKVAEFDSRNDVYCYEGAFAFVSIYPLMANS